MKLSEKIMKIRKAHGLSQEEFGEKINVSRQAVSKWESEQSIPDVDKIKEISKVYKVSYNYLLDDDFEEEKNIEEVKAKDTKLEDEKKIYNKKSVIKIICIVVFMIYLIICAYKFIALQVIHSFVKNQDPARFEVTIESIMGEHEVLNLYSYCKFDGKIKEELLVPGTNKEELMVTSTLFYDFDKDEGFEIVKDVEDENNVSKKRISNMSSMNSISEFTLNSLPVTFKEKLLCSISPFYFVNIVNQKITDYWEDDRIMYFDSNWLITENLVKGDDGSTFKQEYTYNMINEDIIGDIVFE